VRNSKHGASEWHLKPWLAARWEADVREQERLLASALNARDVGVLSRLFASDYVFTSASGQTWGRDRAIADCADPRLSVERLELDVERVIVLAEAAVVVGRSEVKGSIGDESLSGAFRFTHVWRREDGRWQIVAGHTSQAMWGTEHEHP
jgi:ketosteroid isomerase-like protein